MTSSDPESKPATESDKDDDDEYEYEEIEVEVEEEVEVEDDEEEEEEVEYEEVEVEEEEEEVEYEEVEEEEIEYEEVEEEVEEEEEEEVEYEEVEEGDECEEVQEKEVDGGDDVEEIGDQLVPEAKGDGAVVNDTNSHMDCMQHDMRSKQASISIECDTNVSLDTHPIDATKQGNEDEMPAISECAITAKSEANTHPIGLGSDTSIKSDEQNREKIETSLADIETPNIPKLLEHGVGENKATGFEDTIADDVQPVDDVNHTVSRSPLQVRHRSPSPGARYDDGNKRRAVICEYFAKGWCIKGSSCRFLHKRDHIDDNIQKVIINDDALPSSSALNDNQLEHVEYDKTASSRASPCNDKYNSNFDSKEAEGDNFKENYSFDRYNYHEATITRFGSMRRRYLLDGFGSSGSVPYSFSYFSHKEDTSAACNSSPCGEYDAAKISHMNTSKYKSSFVPHNWEPSVPFRPSFFIPSMIRTSSDVQYDPLRDSIEQPDIQSRNSLENNRNLRHGNRDKNYYGHNKDIVPSDSGATSTTGVPNKNIFEEENPSVKDVIKASRNAADVSCDLQSYEKEQILGRLDEEKSKMIKYFRGALIEFVKELMKPVWHEGRLSKDVYKVIVQKAEDKILSTLSLDQVPNTSESIKQYLSLSRPKILKLIQAYVDKYGKF